MSTYRRKSIASCDEHIDRGASEDLKDFKVAYFAYRVSCYCFWVDQFHLKLHVAAYWPLDILRWWLTERRKPRVQPDALGST